MYFITEKTKRMRCENMEIIRNSIHIGLKEPFTVLHASDTHLTFADERDGERKLILTENRSKAFPTAEEDLNFIKEKAAGENRTLIYTGDLIDFVSELNIEKAKDFIDSVDCFFSAGNHEFSLFVGEAKEDAAYRNQSLCKVQSAFKNDIRCSSRIINGVNFVAVDNSYYLFEKEQLDFLKGEAEKEFPVILVVHTPLYTKELYEFSRHGEEIPAYLMSVPEELMKDYSKHRYEQQKEDIITAEAFDFIKNCKNIKGILAGHLHQNFEGHFTDDIYQIVTGLSTVREIYID